MLSCKIAECTGCMTSRACTNSSAVLTRVHPEPGTQACHCSKHAMKLDAANHLKNAFHIFHNKKGFDEGVRVTWRPSLPMMPMPTSAAWIMATSLAPSPMPSILPLRRRCWRLSHLWMPLDPPSAFFIYTTHAQMLPPSIGSFTQEFIHEVYVFLTVGCVRCPSAMGPECACNSCCILSCVIFKIGPKRP